MIDIELRDGAQATHQGVAYLNGQKIRVLFDTGAGYSLLTLGAAEHAGITPASPGVMTGGQSTGAWSRHE